MPKNSLLDSDFDLEDENTLPDFEEDGDLHEEPKEVQKPLKQDDIEVVVKDDTPEEDRGRPTADNLSTDIVTDDEAEKYSKRVRERIKQETARVHAERRAKEDRERQLLEATNYMKQLIRENSQLKEMVENGEKVLVSEHQGRLEGELATARAAYREAHEAGDVNGMLAAQEAIATASAKMQQVQSHQIRPLPRTDESEAEKFYRQAQTPVEDPSAKEWHARNPWFQRDDTMTYMAMATHRKLVESGILPNDPRYYPSIDAEMRKRFPEKFSDKRPQARRSESFVAPAGRTASGGGRTRVVLTESQVKLARRLGLTPEEYASQVAAEQRNGNGDYIHGKS